MIKQLSAIGLVLAVAGASAADDMPTGQALFKKECGICHLQGGMGANVLAIRVGAENSILEDRTDLEADYIEQVVRHGLTVMPRFSRVEVTDAELRLITDYLTKKK